MRRGYSEQECEWIDGVCRAMNHWAMAAAQVEAEARLWASQPTGLHASVQPSQEDLIAGPSDELEECPRGVGSRAPEPTTRISA